MGGGIQRSATAFEALRTAATGDEFWILKMASDLGFCNCFRIKRAHLRLLITKIPLAKIWIASIAARGRPKE